MISKEKVFPITVYFDRDEYQQVRKLAKHSGLSLSDVCRMCVKYVLNEVLIHGPFISIVNKSREKGGEK